MWKKIENILKSSKLQIKEKTTETDRKREQERGGYGKIRIPATGDRKTEIRRDLLYGRR